MNVFNDNAAMLDLCREQDLASLNRVPLLMGVLTGRWSAETKLEEGEPLGPLPLEAMQAIAKRVKLAGF